MTQPRCPAPTAGGRAACNKVALSSNWESHDYSLLPPYQAPSSPINNIPLIPES